MSVQISKITRAHALRNAIITISLLIALLIVFFFAPIVYGYSKGFPQGVNVTVYESPSCYLFGFGAQYSFGHGLNGQNFAQYQWSNQYCNAIPPQVLYIEFGL
jgi:hypothetical protein